MKKEFKKNKPDGSSFEFQFFTRAFLKAQEFISDTKKIQDLLRQAREKLLNQSSKLKQMNSDLESLFRMISAWSKGSYKKVPLQSILPAIAAIIYFLNPFDMIHDYIPVLGFIDDASILAFVISSIRKDLLGFLSWEKQNE